MTEKEIEKLLQEYPRLTAKIFNFNYVLITQPEIFMQAPSLMMPALINHATRTALQMPYDGFDKFKENLARIMTERPKPGLGGLIPGEDESYLYHNI